MSHNQAGIDVSHIQSEIALPRRRKHQNQRNSRLAGVPGNGMHTEEKGLGKGFSSAEEGLPRLGDKLGERNSFGVEIEIEEGAMRVERDVCCGI